jgi:hypothetical protein
MPTLYENLGRPTLCWFQFSLQMLLAFTALWEMKDIAD